MRTRKEVIEELSKAIERRKEADEAIDALKDELKRFDEIPELPVFEVGDVYYRLGDALTPISPNTVGNLNQVHWGMFHTPEYVEAFFKSVVRLAKLFHCKWYLDRDYKPDWEKSATKFHVVYRSDGKFAVDTLAFSDIGTVYFSTREKAKAAAVWMNEHALDEMEK